MLHLSIKAVSGTWMLDTAIKGNIDNSTGTISDQVFYDAADIAISEVYVTTNRSKYLTFLHPTYAES